MAAEHRRRPGKTDSGLEGFSAVYPVVECAAVAILARKKHGACSQLDVDLFIMLFDPWRMGFVTKAQI